MYSYGPAIRNNYLFHYVLSGTGYVEYNTMEEETMRFQVKPNCGFLICPGQIVTYCADKYDPWKYEWVEFNGVQAQHALKLAGLDESNPIYTSKYLDGATMVAREIQYIQTHPDVSAMNLVGHLYLCLDALVETSESRQSVRNQSQESYYVREAINYIERHYVNEITIEEIAKFCGLSRTHFGRLFKKVTGQSPQQYLTNFRMTRAVELMRTTDLTLGEIAARVGYSNQLYFSKVFHRVYGVPPRTWRREDRLVLEKPVGTSEKLKKEKRGNGSESDETQGTV